MSPEFITQISLGIITILGAVLTYLVLPWIKTKVDAEQMKVLIALVEIAVQAAEQLFKTSGMGGARKTYVLNYIRDCGYDITDPQLDAIIEAIVYELNLSKVAIPD